MSNIKTFNIYESGELIRVVFNLEALYINKNGATVYAKKIGAK